MKVFTFQKAKEKLTVYDNGTMLYGKEIYQFDDQGLDNFRERIEELDITSLKDAYEEARAKLTFYTNGKRVKKIIYGLSCNSRILNSFVSDVIELIGQMNLIDL